MRRVRDVGDVGDGGEMVVGGGKLEETSLTPRTIQYVKVQPEVATTVDQGLRSPDHLVTV